METGKTTSASYEELLNAFETTEDKIEKRIGIKDKIVLPTPEEPALTIRILLSKDDSGKSVAVVRKLNKKFREGEAFFMTAEYVDKPGERQLGLNKSLFGSMAAAMKEKGLAFDEIIGKVGDITASYYKAAPRAMRSKVCIKCQGKGCDFCTVTGSGTDAGIPTGRQPPSVYNFRLRDDLMNAVGGENIATQF